MLASRHAPDGPVALPPRRVQSPEPARPCPPNPTSSSSWPTSCAGTTSAAPAIRISRRRTSTRLAARGVDFARAFVQSPVCGGSRMSFYSGRYNITSWRHLQQLSAAHRREDDRRLSAPPRLPHGPGRQDALQAGSRSPWPASVSIPAPVPGLPYWQCGFEPFERDDGLHPEVDGKLYGRRSGLQPAGSASSAIAATTPGTSGPTRSSATTARCCRAGRCATRAGRHACRRSIPRPPT